MQVKKLTDQMGYGNPESAIGVNPDDADLLAHINKLVQSDEILQETTATDDGCGDGRMVQAGEDTTPRPKVFGGGATMAASMAIGVGDVYNSPEEVFDYAMATLAQHTINFGGHSDTNANEVDCGCGAIDKFPLILATAVLYKAEILNSLELLGIAVDEAGKVFAALQRYQEAHTSDAYSGRAVSDAMKREGKLVKVLADVHIEKAIILNTLPGTTVNQALVYQKTDGAAEVFAVDVWRMQQLANSIYDTAELRSRAFLSEVIYTLATAAVLTRGNLPVYVIS